MILFLLEEQTDILPLRNVELVHRSTEEKEIPLLQTEYAEARSELCQLQNTVKAFIIFISKCRFQGHYLIYNTHSIYLLRISKFRY